ncbi:toxin B, partial [Listeria monocytogenes]
FSGIACNEIKNYITLVMNDLLQDLGVLITNNDEKVKALGESYKELDSQLGQTFNYGMERTK